MSTLRAWYPNVVFLAVVLAVAIPSTTITSAQDSGLFKERVLVTVDDDVEIKDSAFVGPYNFARVGSSAAYVGDHNGQTHVYQNGKPGPGYTEIHWFAARGDQVAYAAKTDEYWQVVSGSGAGPKFEEVKEVHVASKGRPVYKARNGKKWCVVLGKKPGPAFDNVDKLVVSAGGKKFAYAGEVNYKWQIVIDGRPGTTFTSIRSGPFFSPNEKTVTYIGAVRQSRFKVFDRVFVGKKAVGEHDKAERVQFLPDGKKVSYVATHGKRQFGIIGKQKYARFDWVSTPMPVASGVVAYAGVKGDKVELMNDDESIAKHEVIGDYKPQYLAISPDGKSYAYQAYDSNDDNFSVVHDGKKASPWPSIYPRFWFHPKDNRVAYVAGDDDEAFVLVGDQRSELFHDVLPELHFSDDGSKIAFCARKGREIRWVVMKVE